MNKAVLNMLIPTLFLVIGSGAYAANALVQIKMIIPDYMPDQIRFSTDTDIGSCVSGVWLDRFGTGSDENTKRESNKIVYSTLLAALMSGKKVNVYVNESNCQVTNLQLTSQ